MTTLKRSVRRGASGNVRRSTACALLLAWAFLPGCGKPPTFQELVGGGAKPPEEVPPTIPQAPVQPATPAAQPAAQPQPAKPDPAAVIAAFKSKQPFEAQDRDIQGLIALEEGFESLDSLNINASQVTNEGVKGISKLTGVRELHLGSTKITDAGLVEIGKMSQLEKLNLSRTGVTPAGFQFLADLANLKELDLSGTAITDAAFVNFKKMVHLEVLRVPDTTIDGSGFKIFHSMPQRGNLREIEAHHTNFGTHGFEHIKGSNSLEKLVVGQSNTTDLSMKGFRLPNLLHIDLGYNNLGDLGVKELADSKKLKHVGLRNNVRVSNQWVSNVFSKNKNLEYIDLDGTSCTQALVGPMKKLNKDLKITISGVTY